MHLPVLLAFKRVRLTMHRLKGATNEDDTGNYKANQP